jgi:hypothetical protein
LADYRILPKSQAKPVLRPVEGALRVLRGDRLLSVTGRALPAARR